MNFYSEQIPSVQNMLSKYLKHWLVYLEPSPSDDLSDPPSTDTQTLQTVLTVPSLTCASGA